MKRLLQIGGLATSTLFSSASCKDAQKPQVQETISNRAPTLDEQKSGKAHALFQEFHIALGRLLDSIDTVQNQGANDDFSIMLGEGDPYPVHGKELHTGGELLRWGCTETANVGLRTCSLQTTKDDTPNCISHLNMAATQVSATMTELSICTSADGSTTTSTGSLGIGNNEGQWYIDEGIIPVPVSDPEDIKNASADQSRMRGTVICSH